MIVGFDTSNYTTSVSTYNNGIICQEKQILSVKSGERGLRQSDAVFQHTVNLPRLIEKMEFSDIKAVGVSSRPRNIDGSYMPCFLCGEAVATAVASTHNAPLYKTSHQVGHILASLYDTNMLDLIYKPFLAFHLSGGTTEALLVTPDKEEIIKAQVVAQSLDLKAGQAIDRAGVLMGMEFPCGKELDRLSALSDREFKIKPSMKGVDCSLSGVENKTKNLITAGESKEDISKFVLTYLTLTVDAMISSLLADYPDLPIIFSGGVSSNSMLRSFISNKYNAYFAKSEFSLDNAAGIAVYAAIKQG